MIAHFILNANAHKELELRIPNVPTDHLAQEDEQGSSRLYGCLMDFIIIRDEIIR